MQRKTLENTSTELALGGPGLVVLLVLLLGATIFLWRARYIRRRTAYITMAALALALLLTGYSMSNQQG